MRLDQVYSDQARHFHHTRKKHWPEMDSFRPIVKKLSNNCKRVDLGCGAARVVPWLKEQEREDICYVGVDTAQGFILLAKELYPGATFVHSDMLQYLRQQEQQSIDCISAIASLQHLEHSKQRQTFFDHSYKSLHFHGYLILTNWSCSTWFCKKYRRQITASIRRSCISLGKWKRNDMLIPRKDPQRQENGKIFDRYYHIFGLEELAGYAKRAGFTIEKLVYMGQDGKETMDRRQSRNSIMICKKNPR